MYDMGLMIQVYEIDICGIYIYIYPTSTGRFAYKYAPICIYIIYICIYIIYI